MPWAVLGRRLLFASGGYPTAEPLDVRLAEGDALPARVLTDSPFSGAISAGSFATINGRFLVELGAPGEPRQVVTIDQDGLAPQWLGTSGTFPPNSGLGGGFDSTAAGHELAVLPGFALLALDDPFLGTELWRTDGTTLGTRLVRDVNIQQDSGSDPRFFAPAGPGVVMAQADGSVRMINTQTGVLAGFPGNVDSPFAHAAIGHRLYFAGTSPTFGYPNGFWETDGTPTGTIFTPTALETGPLFPFQGRLLFGGNAQGGFQFYSPALVYSPVDRSFASLITEPSEGFSRLADPFVAVGDRVFFAGGSDIRATLYVSDGTPAGTAPVILPPTDAPADAIRTGQRGHHGRRRRLVPHRPRPTRILLSIHARLRPRTLEHQRHPRGHPPRDGYRAGPRKFLTFCPRRHRQPALFRRQRRRGRPRVVRFRSMLRRLQRRRPYRSRRPVRLHRLLLRRTPCSLGDMNADGTTDPDDLSEYIAAYFGGCG